MSSFRRGFCNANYSYLKIRDRLSYAFALVSVAAALELEGDEIKEARLALGGVAHKPWRDPAAERTLRGQRADKAAFERAADLLLRDAKGYAHNDFKIDLARRAIVRALDSSCARHAPIAIQQKDPVNVAMQPISAPLHPASTARPRSPAPPNMPASSMSPALPTAMSSTSTIPRGRITRIDATAALQVDGVLDVLTHQNRPPMADSDERLQGRNRARAGLAVPSAL